MNKYFEGELLETPITYKEWKLRWSREHKDKIKEYGNKIILCEFCNKNIKQGKKAVHRNSKMCNENQNLYIKNLIYDLEISNFTCKDYVEIERYLINELNKLKKDKLKFDENLPKYLDEIEIIKKKYIYNNNIYEL